MGCEGGGAYDDATKQEEDYDGAVAPDVRAHCSGTTTTTTGSPRLFPDGLPPEEYGQLKQQEAARQAGKRYGAWGPRFQQTEGPPIGDWMVMPQL